MAEQQAIGKALLISDDVIKRLDEADKRINKIATDSDNMAKSFSTAMSKMSGSTDDLLTKLGKINSIVGILGNIKGVDSITNSLGKTSSKAEEVANKITKVASIINRMGRTDSIGSANYSLLAWQGIQKNIEQINKRQEKLNSLVKEYQYTMSRINSGKGGIISNEDTASYKAAQQEIELNKQLIASYREKQNEIIKYQQLQKTQIRNQEEIISLAKGEKDLPTLRSEDELKKLNQYFSELEKSSAREAAAAEKAAEREEKARQKAAAASYREQNYKQNTTVSGSLAFAETANTIARRTQAIQYLTEARKHLSTTDANYTAKLNQLNTTIKTMNELNSKAVEGSKEVKESHKSLMDTSDQLERKLALVFSVSQIQGYIEKLISVRGEFELQNAALASILQNKEKADMLFERIKDLAIQSPFTLMQLNTYTKQLAAYSVEYDKLYDTTKMLADVSAGLGVDMQRLILAFGQVKAANFLRGTETRQFTEAGINMLGELAKYYSEIEGRIVSIGEVQERQFKRMISFQDVEEVFKRLTSESGIFYNMQEKQAQTLAGQVSNLQDSIDIMLNDIGKENQDILRGIISTIKELIQNWRTIADVAEPIVTTLVTYLSLTTAISASASVFPRLLLNIGVMLEQVKLSLTAAGRAQLGFNAATAANGYILIGAAIIGIIIAIRNAIKDTAEEQEKLNEISSQGYYEAVASAAKYKTLADVVASSTASYKEQKEALEELKRTYSEILPQHYLEADAIKAMKGNYDEATAAIMNYIKAKTQEKQLQAISEEYESNVQGTQQDLANVIQKQIKSLYGFKVAISDINVVLAEFRKRYDEGIIKTEQDARNTLNNLLSERIGEKINISMQEWEMGWFSGGMEDRLANYFKSLQELKTKTDEVIQQSNVQFGDKITLELQEQRKQLDAQIKEANSLLDLIANKYSGGVGSELITDKQVSDAKAKLIEYANAWGIPEEKIKELKGGAYEISQISQGIKIAALKTFANEISKMRFPTNQLASARMVLQGVQREIDSLNPTPIQKYVNNIILSAAKLNNVSLDGLVDAFARADEGVDEFSKRIKGSMDTLTEQLKLYRKAPMLTGWTKEDAKNAEKEWKVLEAAYKSVTPESDKDIKKREAAERKRRAAANKAQKSELDKLKERIDLIKKAGDEYEKLLEYYDEGEAKLRVTNAFSDAFKGVGLSIDMDFDVSGVIKKIENLSNKAGKAGAKAIKEATSELKTERDIKFREKGLDEIQNKVDKIFSDYEFTLDMKTKGIDLNAFKNMLKAVGASNEEIGTLGLNTTSFEEAQNQLRKIIDKLQKEGGEKQIEEAKKIQKQLTDLEVKEAKKRFEELLSLREKYQSKEEKIAKVESDVSNWERELAKYNNAITSRDTLSAMLANGVYSDDSKKKIEDKIKELNDFINSEQKELLELQIQNGKDTILQLKSEALQLTEFWRQLFGDLGDLSVNSLRDLSRIVDEIISSSKEIKDSSGETSGYSATYTDRNGITQQVTLTVEQYQRLLKQNNSVADKIEEKNPFIALFDAIANGKNEDETTLDYLTRLSGIIDEVISQTFDLANNMADIFGSDEDTKELISNYQNIISGTKGLGLGIARIASGDALGGFTSAIKGIASISTALTSIHDNKREKEIERQQILVESLEKSYQKLYDTIGNGLSLDTYTQNAALIQNLRKQIDSYQAMIAAERDKKDTDDNRIRDWQDSIDDLNSQIDELYDNLKTSLIGDFKNIAEQLGDAIAEAFQNGTDEAEAWGESVNEIVADIVKNLLVQKLIEPKVQEIVDQMFASALPKTSAAAEARTRIDELRSEYERLSNSIADDFSHGKISQKGLARKKQIEKEIARLESQYDDLVSASEGEVPNITQEIIDQTIGSLTKLGDEILDNPAWNMLKELLQGANGDTMSGLEKGIKGLSEETGEALEALLNSMRYYVADTNTDIKNIYNFLVNTPIESPLMQELRVQSNYLSSISSLLNSVSKNVQSSGKAIKVQIV